ncbi:MAG: hypothetical protein OQK75_02905 [Gammaproteobacteria bacterium]|nr:hypothetical protein [Gammaproteobacteria bacterium]MCW9029958.1 hypothetical protein [Gammaproteobacteria bacterium]
MKTNIELCPFSKPILGRWCQCRHAKLVDRCSGKMSCTRFYDLKKSCHELDDAFKRNTRFILGVKNEDSELTHAHLMKIRCGGLIGMQRVLHLDSEQTINVPDVIERVNNKYGSIEQFPYNEIVQDIKNFKHRK